MLLFLSGKNKFPRIDFFLCDELICESLIHQQQQKKLKRKIHSQIKFYLSRCNILEHGATDLRNHILITP